MAKNCCKETNNTEEGNQMIDDKNVRLDSSFFVAPRWPDSRESIRSEPPDSRESFQGSRTKPLFFANRASGGGG